MENNFATLIADKATLALAITFLMNWLKKQAWFPVMNYQTEKFNHAFSVLLAGIGTLGIHMTFTGGTLTITGLTWATVGSGVVSWIQTYLATKTAYTALKGNLNPAGAQTPTPVVVVPDSKKI